MAVSVETRPRYLDQRKLYGLGPNEEIIVSETFTPGWKNVPISQGEIDTSIVFKRAHKKALETARRIEHSPRVEPEKVTSNMSSEEELYGEFTGIRVVIMRDPITGHRVKGFTLIGVPLG